MKAYIDDAHRRGLDVKIYNTVRALSNRSFETFALRRLGHEIYSPGKGSTMLGYWAPGVPVRTGRDDVLATVYRRHGRSLVAIASWAPTPVTVRLAVDWKALGLDGAPATFTAPALRGLQEARTFAPGDGIEIAPGKGTLLVVR